MYKSDQHDEEYDDFIAENVGTDKRLSQNYFMVIGCIKWKMTCKEAFVGATI